MSSLTTVTNLLVLGQPFLPDLDGLASLTTVRGQLFIADNPGLTSVDGLESLASVGNILVVAVNPKLESLDGLRSLTSVDGSLFITDNPLLTDFCGLYALLDADGLAGTYNVSGNGANPTAADIIAAGPCLTFDGYLGELVEEGILNEGEVKSLEKLAEKNPKAFANRLNALARNGTLSEDDAFLILFLWGTE